jgi:hypothetical protein
MNGIIQYLKSDETKKRIVALIDSNIYLYQGISSDDQIQKYTGIIYNQFVRECVQNNQYVSLSNRTINLINDTYRQLVINLRGLSNGDYRIEELETEVTKHRDRLISAIEKNDYRDKEDQLFIPCAEYSGEFQEMILRTGLRELQEPIIDIGCGVSCGLIRLLRGNGYAKTFGMDQYSSNDPKIICSNWFDYHFQESTWGTVIAHMSFSNHLRKSLISGDALKDAYAGKYTEILRSLKPRGLFIYAPSVKALEDTLDKTEYAIQYYRNLTDEGLDTVHIQKSL